MVRVYWGEIIRDAGIKKSHHKITWNKGYNRINEKITVMMSNSINRTANSMNTEVSNSLRRT